MPPDRIRPGARTTHIHRSGRTTVFKKKQSAGTYEQGAAECREIQKRMEAAGRPDLARAYGEAMDANLDRASELKKGRR
jgi:hypothetical protein